ncbi:MAG: asparaginase domain-containing protein [Xanthomonadales bacterium]|nr:asparaginase domain-containing protein [Xanthomonadales bacterium]
MKKLLIITTGGTIDKIYFDDMSDYQIGEPLIGQILDHLQVGFEFEINALMRKDSLHITDEDRITIHDAVAASDASHVLVTHGTDSMVKTALLMADIPNKTMVLTGALNPARFRDSDAIFNIGCAVGAVQSLPAGAWIAMSGTIWDPKKVRKNRSENRFEATTTVE